MPTYSVSLLITLLGFFATCSSSETPSIPASISQSVEIPTPEIIPIDSAGMTIATRFSPPADAQRISLDSNSFGYFLRHHRLLPVATSVRLYSGELKSNQSAHVAVLDVSVGKRDLQQCADAIMRLRGDYLWAAERYSEIGFHFTNGFFADYNKWRAGQRIRVVGNDVQWTTPRTADHSYQNFKRYLQMVFAYAGTLSLAKELAPQSVEDMQIGDVFIQGGSPGHAIIVVDQAENTTTGQRYFMLAQSYMPAQNIHVLINPNDSTLSPWYIVEQTQPYLRTPEWTFRWTDLKRF